MKGINKITFAKYFELPGIINDRLFAVFDKNKNDYLDSSEFIHGMSNLYTEGFETLTKFIFDFYDFDKDGKISKEDVRVVLSYIPLNTQNMSKMKFEK
jgi:Ca2+-binding EF-hand superfamily protein